VIRTIERDSALLFGRERRMARHGPMMPVEILLVEDSPDDAALMVVALREGGLTTRVSVVEDGEQAIDYLRRAGEYAAVPLPHLVLLDLFLPRKKRLRGTGGDQAGPGAAAHSRRHHDLLGQ